MRGSRLGTTPACARGEVRFEPAPPGRVLSRSTCCRRRCAAGHSSHRMVFVDGAFRSDLSSSGTLPAGCRRDLAGRSAGLTAGLAGRYLGKVGVTDFNPFQALNTAFLADGLVVHVPKGVAVPNRSRSCSSAAGMTNRRCIIRASWSGRGSQCRSDPGRHHVGLGTGTYFSTSYRDRRWRGCPPASLQGAAGIPAGLPHGDGHGGSGQGQQLRQLRVDHRRPAAPQ